MNLFLSFLLVRELGFLNKNKLGYYLIRLLFLDCIERNMTTSNGVEFSSRYKITFLWDTKKKIFSFFPH